MKRIGLLLATLFAIVALPVAAQGDRMYTEGAVTQVASIKITAGHFDEYMAYLSSTWKKEQEALKAAGLILDYAAYSTSAHSSHEADVYLTTTYANMAALDNLDDRSDPVIAKALGTNRVQDAKGMADRNAYREVMGTELIRELKLK